MLEIENATHSKMTLRRLQAGNVYYETWNRER